MTTVLLMRGGMTTIGVGLGSTGGGSGAGGIGATTLPYKVSQSMPASFARLERFTTKLQISAFVSSAVAEVASIMLYS